MNTSALDMHGLAVEDIDGTKVGDVVDFYFDARTEDPQWLAVEAGTVGHKIVLVPVEDITRTDGGLRTPYQKDMIMDAPHAEGASLNRKMEEARYTASTTCAESYRNGRLREPHSSRTATSQQMLACEAGKPGRRRREPIRHNKRADHLVRPLVVIRPHLGCNELLSLRRARRRDFIHVAKAQAAAALQAREVFFVLVREEVAVAAGTGPENDLGVA